MTRSKAGPTAPTTAPGRSAAVEMLGALPTRLYGGALAEHSILILMLVPVTGESHRARHHGGARMPSCRTPSGWRCNPGANSATTFPCDSCGLDDRETCRPRLGRTLLDPDQYPARTRSSLRQRSDIDAGRRSRHVAHVAGTRRTALTAASNPSARLPSRTRDDRDHARYSPRAGLRRVGGIPPAATSRNHR